MKQKNALKTQKGGNKCSRHSCRTCQNCKVLEFNAVAQEAKSNSFQLYAREAENYFYYAPSINNYR